MGSPRGVLVPGRPAPPGSGRLGCFSQNNQPSPDPRGPYNGLPWMTRPRATGVPLSFRHVRDGSRGEKEYLLKKKKNRTQGAANRCVSEDGAGEAAVQRSRRFPGGRAAPSPPAPRPASPPHGRSAAPSSVPELSRCSPAARSPRLASSRRRRGPSPPSPREGAGALACGGEGGRGCAAGRGAVWAPQPSPQAGRLTGLAPVRGAHCRSLASFVPSLNT